MKTCPYCGELVGDDVEVCFNCNYNFITRTIEKGKNAEIEPPDNTSTLPRYEYAVEIINDNPDGSANLADIISTLTKYSTHGWRLHSTLSNEIGKDSSSVGVAGIGIGVNATIDQIIFIFERPLF